VQGHDNCRIRDHKSWVLGSDSLGSGSTVKATWIRIKIFGITIRKFQNIEIMGSGINRFRLIIQDHNDSCVPCHDPGLWADI